MDELQARFRTMRSLQTDMNLAKQPYPEFEGLDEGAQQSEANVVEMPSRQTQEAPSDQSAAQRTTKRKQRAVAKRKPITPTEKAFSFRQMRDGHQQPYIDELKRLEAQAERINQLLAERKRKKAQSEQAGLASGASSAALSSSTTKKSTRSNKQTPRSPQREVSPMPAQDDDTDALEAQAERIKQLLKDLESALIEGETVLPQDAIAIKNPDDLFQATPSASAIQPPPANIESVPPGTYRYGGKAPPLPAAQQGMLPDTDPKAQQEATETAQALRSLASREGSRELVHSANTPINHSDGQRTVGRSRTSQPISGSLPRRHYGMRLRQLLQVPQTSFDRVGDAVLWIVLAVVIRVGARLLLALLPALTPIFVVLMFAPAILAVYLAMFVPRAGFVSVYRLFLMMLGLLIGGRL